ncbi:hypothetical protein O7635_27885 [Asanoa sp. WMMD1127]|uniref:hypothetical protein n=1 Tax=Asanoa sp. WMMD1127 TaxID=3016107 RepID=UPI0024175D47|nr:hypothetical protein [Asanoa sp. WMMD1127]MDG4825684.1 hypothetical protein [Asanoa sp. WMMD1127]
MTVLPSVPFTFLPCPAWCQEEHEDQFAPLDVRLHTKKIFEGGRGLRVVVSRADVAIDTDDQDAGSIGDLAVQADAGDGVLSVAEARVFSVALQEAAYQIEGLRASGLVATGALAGPLADVRRAPDPADAQVRDGLGEGGPVGE